MTDDTRNLSRRTLMRSAVAGGAAVAAGATFPVAAQDDEEEEENGEDEEENGEDEDEDGDGAGREEPDWGGWLDDAPNYDDGDTVDARGEEEVTVEVGGEPDGLTFEPAGIWIDPGTTVIWEWTGEGGDHDVTSEEGEDLNSDLTAEPGVHYEYTFEDDGITTYYCSPHIDVGMLGGVAVGDVETVEIEDGAAAAGGIPLPDAAKSIGVAIFAAMAATLSLAYVFMKYGGIVEE